MSPRAGLALKTACAQAIVDDYAAIAVKLRRLRGERGLETEIAAEQQDPSILSHGTLCGQRERASCCIAGWLLSGSGGLAI
jgi:hypothetical protein